MKNSQLKTSAAVSALLACALAAVGCSRQAYVVGRNASSQAAPGSFIIPPKVDILLAQDDTGSAFEPFRYLDPQMKSFLGQLDGKTWDYHFATIPLTDMNRAVSQVAASRYDSHWGADWLIPYPWSPPFAGAPDPRTSSIPASVFRATADYGDFLDFGQINRSTALEPTFSAIDDAFHRRLDGTGFLRDDAMLVIIIAANGDDTSGVNICTRSDNYQYPCRDQAYYDSLTAYENAFKHYKGSPDQVRVYSLVSPNRYTGLGCMGGNANPGSRYIEIARRTGGQSYDICTQPIGNVLTSLASHLTAQRLDFETHYLFIEETPQVDSIEVTVYRGGDAGRSELIPMDPDNGWTYADYLTNVYAIDYPFEMNLSSGYAIELHGAARLKGADRADVTYKPAGASDSKTN
jgi:hypothetical protein